MATIAGHGAEVFAPKAVARQGRLRRRSLRSPLGIYTSPLILLIAWQVLCSTGALSPTLAASPSQVVSAGAHLWSHGEPSTLRADLGISLARALAGLAIGVTVGGMAGTFAGLTRLGEHLFNGPVQMLNTIPFLALLPLMIVWFGIGESPRCCYRRFGAGIPMYINLFAAIRGVDPAADRDGRSRRRRPLAAGDAGAAARRAARVPGRPAVLARLQHPRPRRGRADQRRPQASAS